MLALKLLRRRRKEHPPNLKFLAFVAIAIIAIFLFLRFFEWIDDSQRSLLPATVTLLEGAHSLSGVVPLPEQIFNAELFAVGIYTAPVDEIPQGTIVVVYTRNDWRFVEIDYLPERDSTQYLATHIYPTQEIKIDEAHTVWIQTVDERPRCIDYEDDLPNRCEISRHLIADLNGRLLLIAADGDHPTDGELVEMAKSIMNQ